MEHDVMIVSAPGHAPKRELCKQSADCLDLVSIVRGAHAAAPI